MFTTPTTSVPPPGPAAGVRGVQPGTDGPPPPDKASEPKAQDTGNAPAPAAPAASSTLKLVVAKAEASMAYTYTLVDQITGRVVAEIPHQAAQEAAASPNYTAGGVVDTTA